MPVRSVMPVGALIIGAALALGPAALPAFATDTNQPATWQSLPGESCDDVGYTTSDSVTHPYVLPSPEDGRAWSKVIVKAGSTGHSVTDENTVYTSGLVTGAPFVHAEKGSISHVIVCSVPTAVPDEDPETEDPETEDPETEDPETEDPETEDPEAEDPEMEDPQPEALTRFAVTETIECAANTVTVVTTTFETPYVFDGPSASWVPGEVVAGEPVTTFRAPTEAELIESCGFVDTDPEASGCAVYNPLAPFSSWIRVDFDPRVIYRIDGVIVTSEFTEVSEGIHVVTAAAAPGYVLLPGATTSWTYDVVDSARCGLGTLTPPDTGRIDLASSGALASTVALASTGTDPARATAAAIAWLLAGLTALLVARWARVLRRG